VIRSDSGQAIPLHLALTVVILSLMAVGFGVIEAVLELERRQSIADVAALAGAEALRAGAVPVDSVTRAVAIARANGSASTASVPDADSPMPTRVRVRVSQPLQVGIGRAAITIPASRTAEAMVVQPAGLSVDPGPGDYGGPFLWRQGKPMRPDVAFAFDRMSAAADARGLKLQVVSAWRSTVEQARLFAAHPDPRWVARPGTSLHRLGTELDLGPANAYGWLASNAGKFGFLKRYAWEPWHFGYTRSPGSASVGWGRALRQTVAAAGPRAGSSAVPAWVPGKYVDLIRKASISHGVAAAVLAAQIRAESDFNPRDVSSAGAQGIVQLMPYESARFHVDPFDPAQAIGAQARLMRELLSRFGSVPLALAAYNAGPNAVARCGCIPPYPETRAYVAKILSWIDGSPAGAGPAVVLVA